MHQMEAHWLEGIALVMTVGAAFLSIFFLRQPSAWAVTIHALDGAMTP
jgi:hypothetical protein